MVPRKPECLIVGLGNSYRSDDAVGLVLAGRLKSRMGTNAEVLEFHGEPLDLLDIWSGFRKVILIDAATGGGNPGSIHRFEAHQSPISSRAIHFSSHQLNIPAAIELARTLDKLPPEIIVYGVEAASFSAGTSLSSEVEKALTLLEDQIMKEVRVSE
ncbi:MAG TPA: hydrogenase maturation protease [Bacteroidota bacterium]|nr:hydrogenase maturation protease [Bacteroidota bacterium]